MKILYIEDDYEIGRLCREDLEERGYEVTWLQSGEQAHMEMENVDVVVLDVMLPGLDGFTVGRRLKKQFPDVPVVMLSARSAVEDKLQGLEFADDYVTKPFHPEELDARIQVVRRRAGKPEKSEIKAGHLVIDPAANRIMDTAAGREIVLTGKQFHIFMYLLKHPNQVLTKEQIYEAVWGEPYMDGDKSIMVHIRHLREKIERNPGSPEIIETIRGLGYRVRLS